MTVCAFLVDVVIGELQLVQPSAIFQRTKDSICPIIGVKISNGPLLYIPFLTPENIKNHLKYIHHGHHSLPVEVEEGYLNGGKFLFQRGKSCLFTACNKAARHNSITTAAAESYGSGAVLHGRSIKIVVLNGLCFPPSVFGSCETVLTTVDQAKLKQMLRGKLSVCNDKGEVVAHLTLSVSCRNLGESIIHHTRDFGIVRTGDLDRSEMPGVSFLSGQASNKSVNHTSVQQRKINKWKNNIGTSVSKIKLNKTHDAPQHTDDLTVAHVTLENNSTTRAQNSVLEQPFSYRKDSGESKEHHMHHDLSEIIALKFSEFESNLRDDSKGNRNISVANHRTNFESKQPAPILYTGHNNEAEMSWNNKILDMGEYVIDQVDSEYHNWKGPTRKTCSEDRTIPKERSKNMEYDSQKHPQSFAPAHGHKRKTKRINIPSPVNSSSVRMKQSRSLKPLYQPSGWLRSTPVAVQQQDNRFLNPKLNRTSLLRKAKLDPQLAHQLHAEIHYQVKQRLRCLDEGLKVELVKIKSKKFVNENTYGKLTVGCQTEDDLGANLQNFYNTEKTYTHETSLNEDEQYKGKQQNIDCKNEQRFQVGPDISLKKNFGLRENGRMKMIELKGNHPLDNDVAKLQVPSKNPFSGNYNEDLKLFAESESVRSSHTAEIQNENNFVPQTNSDKGEERSPVAELRSGSKVDFGLSTDSESVSMSHMAEIQSSISNPSLQTKRNISQKLKEWKATNKIRDSMFKSVDTESEMLDHSEIIVREHLQGTALAYKVDKDLSPQENTSKVVTCETDQYFNQNVHFSPKYSNVSLSAVKNLKTVIDTLSSQTSEVSEASNLSHEVLQEVLKGRQADFPEESDEITESLCTSREDKLSKGHSSAGGNITCPDESLESSAKCSRSDSILLTNDSSILTSCKPVDQATIIDKSVTKILKDMKMTDQGKVIDKGGALYSNITSASNGLENYDKNQSASEKSSSPDKHYKRKGATPQDMDDIDSSISDISAQIAALLMPKRVSIPQLNTDSVSSYVPSNVSDTLSSLSEMVGD